MSDHDSAPADEAPETPAEGHQPTHEPDPEAVTESLPPEPEPDPAVDEAPAEVEAAVDEAPTEPDPAADEAPAEAEEPVVEAPTAAVDPVVAEPATADEVDPAAAADLSTSDLPAAEEPSPAPTYKPAIEAQDLSALPADVDFEQALEMTMLDFNEGDIVKGTVVAIDRDSVLVDIGFKSEGVIPVNELSIRKSVDPAGVVEVGDEVEALVLDKEDDEGRLVLSKKRAQYERAWGRIEQVANSGGTVEGPVIEVVKGGLIVDIGLRGFLPASLVELRRVRDLDPYVGQSIEAKVIELDRNRNNVVLSRRAHLEEEQAEQRHAFLDDLAEGETREGTVSSVVNFGAFVDLGGMDGLVHVSELSYQHVNHPGEVVKVGDKVTVKVLEVDRDRERISLSIKQTQADPWEAFASAHEVGDAVDGAVTKTVPFGAFVTVGEGVEGLVHVSEIAMHRVESPELELTVGQTVKVKITEMDTDRRRVSLSIKRALPGFQDRPESAPRAAGAPAGGGGGGGRDDRPRRRRPQTREFEREEDKAKEEEEPAFNVDASLEAILQELKERGIGRR
ncbi:MAG: 30S ribosomal protein S1 [Acidimicrobiia bacterium]